jgi:hypothetical protein
VRWGDGRDGGGAGAGTPERPQLVLAEPRRARPPKRRSSHATSTSQTDPDAKLRGKPGQRPRLVHRRQAALKLVLAPIFEADFRRWSTGLGPG